MHDQVKTGRVPQVSLLRPGTTPGALHLEEMWEESGIMIGRVPGAPHLEEMWEGSGIMIGRVPYISKRCGRKVA